MKASFLLKLSFALLLATMCEADGGSYVGSWNYFQGGADWTSTCASGTSQSPIDIPLVDATHSDSNDANKADLEESDLLEIELEVIPLLNQYVQDLNYTNKVSFGNGTGVLFVQNNEGTDELYKLIQFHIHAPSEHTFDGEHYDLEIHLVHQNYEGHELAVTAIYFDIAEGGNKTNSFIDALDIEINNATVPLIPLQKLYSMVDTEIMYHYEGSLTTPPCTEGVQWWILPEPLHISEKQMDVINAQWKNNSKFAGGNGNNRLTQPLNGRTIYHRQITETDALEEEKHLTTSSSVILKSYLSALALMVMTLLAML